MDEQRLRDHCEDVHDYSTQNKETNAQGGDEEKTRNIKRISLIITAMVIFMFLAIIFITDAIEVHFGKTVGTVVMAIMVLIVAAIMYRREILSFFRKK